MNNLPEFNPASNDHLKKLFFGGSFKTRVAIPVVDFEGEIVYYKTGQKQGQIKIRLEEKNIKFKGLGLQPLDHWKTEKGNISVNESMLEELINLLKKESKEKKEVNQRDILSKRISEIDD